MQPEEKTRNQIIYERSKTERITDLAREYGLNRQRIYQIIRIVEDPEKYREAMRAKSKRLRAAKSGDK